MSWGYVPKKLKYARRQRRMRKKYKNFGCSTCANTSSCKIRRKYIPEFPFGATIITRHDIEFCPSWKASYRAKVGNIAEKFPAAKSSKKRTVKELIESIF